MSADLLRRAAKTLREHAEHAARDMGTSAWKLEVFNGKGYPQRVTNDRATLIAECFEGGDKPTFAPYIALMHPPVALALADWLDQAARHVDARIEAEQHVGIPADTIKQDDERRAEDVARAILREGATDATP